MDSVKVEVSPQVQNMFDTERPEEWRQEFRHATQIWGARLSWKESSLAIAPRQFGSMDADLILQKKSDMVSMFASITRLPACRQNENPINNVKEKDRLKGIYYY